MLNERVTDLICEGMMMDVNDPTISVIWDELINLLSANIKDTVDYLDSCNEKEIEFLSAIFEDVAYKLKRNEYIAELEIIKNKYPKLNMDMIINLYDF